jgi:hypothetical protein
MDDADALASGLARSFERLAQVSLGGYFQRWPHGRASVDLEDFDLFEFARLVLWESNVPSRSIDDVIRAAEERLQTARFGLEDMSRPERAQSGLYNAVVFGRMVTFALQNLRHIVPEFEDWYDGKVKQMRSDPLMGYFSELRTKIEKQVGRHTSVATHIRQFNLPGDMQRFDRPPPGATAFLIGDPKGGSGWQVTAADGSTEMYYVDLPPEIGEVTMHLYSAPGDHSKVPAAQLVAQYLDGMERFLTEAKERFGGQGASGC